MPLRFKAGMLCPCHMHHLKGFERRILGVYPLTRKFSCSMVPLGPPSIGWHWFDEAYAAMGERQEVNEYGEVAP